MAKDYAEMLRKAREGYAAATSGDTSGASKSGAKDYAKMLQDARNRVQGIQSNNDADAAQRASNERTVAARYYTNNLQYPGTVKKTPEQQSHDRVVYARQPAVQQQLKNRADMLNIGNAIQTTPRSQSAMSGASMAQSLAQNVPNQYAPADKNALPKSLANVPPKNVEQKGALEYISEKGQEAFYNANQSINQTIEAASQAVFGFFGDVVNNKGVSPEEKLNSGLAKAKERFVDTLERNRAENPPDNTTDVSPEYESARSKPAVKIAGDVNAVMSSMLPRYMVTMGASGLGATAASAAGTLGMATSAAQTFQNAYNEARNDGADEKQAALFAARNASTDAIIERFTGGVLEGGAGIADSAIQKYAGNALNNFFRSKPMAKTISYVVAKGIGEGTEEVLQDIAKTEAKRLTYGSDEKLDPKSLAYSGILGFAMGSLFSGMEAPARYSVYKSDYNTVNLLSIGAGEVKSNADADSMEATADAIINAADKAIDELQNTKPSEDVDVKEEISRLNYVKDGAQKVKDTLSENRADIIEQNLAKEDATQNAVDGTPDTIIDDTAKLVNTVADTIEPDKNAVNATIDHVVQEIRNTDVQQNVAQTDVEKQEIAAKRSKLEEIDKTLRNNRKDVEEARKDAKNKSDTPEVGTKKTVSEPIEPKYHEGKGVVQYFVPSRKTPVATSTQSDLDTLKLFGGNTTIKQAYETPLMSGQGVKTVLDAYVSRGYGDVTLHDMFGFDGENQFEANASRNPNAKVVPVDSANASTAEATPTTPTPNAETEKTVETSEKPLTTEQKDATIPVDNASQEQTTAEQAKPDEAPTQETKTPAVESSPATDSRTKRAPNEFTLKHVVKKHSKTGEDLDVYQIPKNLSSNEYARLKKNMVGIGGYYSSFVKGFIVPRDKIDRIEYFADVEEAAPEQNVQQGEKSGIHVAQVAEKAEENTVQDSSETVVDSAEAKPIVEINKASGGETNEEQAEIVDGSTPPASETEKAKTKIKKSVETAGFEYKSKNARNIGTAIANSTLSLDNIVYGGKVNGFSDEQRKHFAETLIAGSYTDADTIHTKIPFDGTFDIKNNPTVIGNALDALKIKLSSAENVGENSNENVKKITTLFQNAYKVVSSKHDGTDYVTDGSILIKVSPENLSEIRSAFDAEGKMQETQRDFFNMFDSDNIELLKIHPRKAYKIPASKKGGGITAVSFETPDSKETLFDSRYVKTFDGKENFWAAVKYKPAGDKYSLASVDKDGNINGLIVPINVSSTSNYEQVAFNSKSKLWVGKGTENTYTGENNVQNIADQNKPASTQISDYVLDKLTNNGKITTQELQSIADKAHGGTMAEGKYDVKSMTDAMELGVNRYIIDTISNAQSDFNSPKAEKAVESLDEITESILNAIPTQTKRSEEQVSLQQFSTPPNIAYLASWVANIDNKDTVLEPSAGIGGLASFAKADGATVYVNELSDSRLEMLKQLPFDGFFKENAEQINNILPDSVSPSVVLMNPPFSSTGGRTKNSTKNAIPHIEQALLRLQDGGRLVAIVGKGMADDTPAFRNWYNELREKYNIRANIGIDGENYKKYGTTFDVQMLVIDKTGPQTGETITGTYKDLHEIPKLLEGIRNDRSRENQQLETGESGRKDVGIHRGADVPKELGVADTIRENVSEHDSGVPLGVSEQGNSSGSGRIVADTENPQHAGIVQTDDGGSGRGGSDTGIRERSTDAKGLHEEVSERGRGDMAVQRGDNAGHDIDSDGSTARRDKPRTRGDERLGRGDVAESAKQYHKAALDSSEDNGTYATYTPEKLNIKGAKPHPTKLVESSAMSSVHAPDLHYVPNLDRDIITKGVLSDAQLEAVMYAGQAHETVLPNGNRKGFLIGDGTGVGKGREISGIILDNFNSGRTKAVWVSVSSGLVNDARRDWVDLGGKESDIIDFSKEKGKKGGIGKFDKGIMFVSYDTLKSGKKGGETNADIIADWFGKDFDGVIVFDEAHKAGNLIAEKTGRGSKKPSQNAIKANDFQNSLKNARVVYASATIADKVSGLAFVSRLGLWGDGTQFSGVDDFVGKIGGSGMAAMELVARDMKATGAYISRNLSYDGVGYERLEHTLTKDQIYMYDTMSEGWQVVMQDVDKAMRITGNKSKNADSQLWSSMMRFYDQVLVSMSMPSVISDIEKQLADGKACVVQVVNTQEAAQERAVEKMREDGSEDYDNLDITPRQILEQYLLNSFPVEQYEKYVDENGNEQSRVARDSNGQPIINKEAVAMRDALLERIKDISIPEGPIDMLINHFGKDRVAEVSGRDRRFVNATDENGNIKRVEDVRGDGAKNGSRAANDAEAKAFQNGEKDILIFSAQAGGTGYSYHADKRAKNSRQRVGYILQTAPNSQLLMQTIGRIHRSNEAFPPIYKLVSTDLSAQKRFVTSSARRLEQLGALTKGQRQASGGIFSADDNLETDLSSDALLAFFDRLGHGKIPGMDPKKILSKMGYTKYFYDEYGNFKLNKDTGSNVTRFLNRILALGVEDGNRVFDEFMDIRQAYYEAAEEAGTLDTGMENVKADKLDIVQRETVYTDESTGAETQYVQAKVYNKPTVIQTLDDAMAYRPQFQGIRRMEDGSVRAVYRIADQTNSFGIPVKRFRLQGANTAVSNTMSEKNMNAKTEEIPKAEWEAVWKEAVKDVPEYNESELHMITGALLPVWNKLPQDGNIKAMRITATDGTQYLGRVIPPKQIDAVLRSLGASKSSIKKQYTGKELYSAVMDKAQAVSFDGLYGATWTVSRRRVSGENRLEVTGRNLFAFKEKYPDVFTETIQYKQRYFIPTGSKGEEILGKLAENGVRSVGNPEPDDVAYYSKTQGNWGSRSGKDGKLPMPKNISDIYKAAKEIFGIAINSGKVKNGAEGVYNTHANTIRTRVYGDLPTIAHELGHMFDKRYKLSDMESVNELVKNYKTDLEEAGYNESLYPKEAVAMYFADLLRDGEYAQQKNPQFSTALFDAMSDIDKNKLADFKQMTENYFRMDDKERRRAQVRYRYKDKSTMGKAKFQVESFLRDPKGYMGKRSRDFMREVFDDVFELRYFDGAHTLAMRERQSDSIAKGRLEYAFTDNHGKVIGKSLKSVLYEGDITDLNKKDFEAYLIARVALDRLENNEKDPTAAYLVYADKDLGSKEALVNAILDYERENPTFADTANGVYEYRHNLLTVAVDSGIISEKLAERMEKQLPHYVPLYRYVEDKNNVSPLAKFKGSGRDIYSPIENLATQTAAITKAIQKNETRKALFNAIDTNEDMGLWAEKVPPDKFFDMVSTQEIPDKIMKFLQSGGNGAMTDDDMVEFTEELMKYIGGSVGMWKIKNKQNDKIVSVMRNGVPEYYEMHDPGLVKALENMNPHKSNAFISLMGTATRISSTLVTSVSPRFGLFTNPIRDFYSGYIFSKTTNNPVTYTIDWFKAFIEAVRNTDDFKAYVANGGGYVGCITSKANVLRGIYKDMVKPSSKLKESINPRNWLESLSGLANAIDSAPRFAEYKRALEQNGGDVIAAVQEGMDVTVNFRQSGRTTKEINNLVMFNSARVTAIGQNSERILKNRRIFAKWLTVNFLKTAMHIAALVLFSKMFDEGDEDTLKDYQNLSTYNKFANWCYPIGDGQFLRVPKEQNVMALSSVLDATWERFVLENPDAFKDMDEYLVDALMVADPNPMKAAGDLISDVTFFGTVLDLAKNETFTGAPIVPNGYQYRAAPEQYNEKTSALAIKLGSITGMSPFQIDYIIDDTTGFVGDVILNLTKQGGTTLKDAVGLKDTSKKSVLKGIPVPGVVLRDSVYSTDVVSNFYDTKEGYDKRSGSYDAVGEAGGKYSFYDTYGSYKYQKIADVYSKANARLKLEKNDEAKRLLRRAMNTFIQSANDTEKTKMDERISKLAENTGYTVSDIAPYIVVPDSVSGKMPDGVKVSYELDGYDLLDYYTMSQLYFQYYCNDILNSTASDEEKAEALKKAKREVKEDLNDIFFEKLK